MFASSLLISFASAAVSLLLLLSFEKQAVVVNALVNSNDFSIRRAANADIKQQSQLESVQLLRRGLEREKEKQQQKQQNHRQLPSDVDLSAKQIFGYRPKSEVVDYGLLDLDQKEIEADLGQYRLKLMHNFANDDTIEKAHKVYTNGVHSSPYARLKLKQPYGSQATIENGLGGVLHTIATIDKGTLVKGRSGGIYEVSGTLLNDLQLGALYADVKYSVTYSPVTSSWNHQCVTGSTTDPPVTTFCFASDGAITIGSKRLEYEYDPSKDNFNAVTFKSLSTRAKNEMYLCDPNTNSDNAEALCPYLDYEKFFDYYRRYQYAHEWTEHSINATVATNLPTVTIYENGNADFHDYAPLGRIEAFRKGTVLLNLWMYIVGRMEYALDSCKKNCEQRPTATSTTEYPNCNDLNVIEPWDAAVALYTGSLAKPSNDGFLLYKYANQECKYFKTCSAAANSTDDSEDPFGDKEIAAVNRAIFSEFILGQDNLSKAFKENGFPGACSAARKNKENIVNLMKVPLVQGTLRYAYYNTGLLGDETPTAITFTDTTDHRSVDKAIGSVYVASILPYIYACSHNDALIIYDNMKVHSTELQSQFTQISFNHVKEALERNYKCLGITCEQVGGLYDSNNNRYYFGAEACSDEAILGVGIDTDVQKEVDQPYDGTIEPSTDMPTKPVEASTEVPSSEVTSSENGKPFSSNWDGSAPQQTYNSYDPEENENGFAGNGKIKAGTVIGIGIALFLVALITVIVCSCSWDRNPEAQWGNAVTVNKNGEVNVVS